MKASEKRINKNLLKYWEKLFNANGCIPHKSSVNPEEINDIWSNCFIMDANKIDYDFLGKDVKAIKEGNSLVVKDIYNSLLCPDNSNIKYIVKEVLTSKAPVSHDSSFKNPYGLTIKYRRCFLPLRGDNDDISYVLGCLRWKSTP